jgi:hypothetical protein
MSREIVASAVLAPNQYPLLLLHRHVPERTLPDLLAASCLVNDGVLCLRGVPLVAGCAGWRARA